MLINTRGGSYTVNKFVYFSAIILLFLDTHSIRNRSKEETRIQ
jgi:hypothetical protein